MNKTIIWLIVAIVVIAGIWWGVSRKSVQPPTAKKEVIKIGAIFPLTGPASSLGETWLKGMELKVKELQDEGYNIKLVVEDSQSDPKEAVRAFNKLVNIDNIDIIFTTVSSIAMALKPLAEEKEVLLWADSSHPLLTKDSRFILRHASIADNDGKIIAEDILEQGFKKVGIIHSQDDYGLAVKDSLVSYLTKEEVEVFTEAIDLRGSDFRTQITKIKSQDPSAIVFITIGPSAGYLIKQTRELKYDKQLYSSVGFSLTPDAQTIAGEYATGMRYQTYKENPAFEKAFEEKFGRKPSLLSYVSYTDVELLIYTIEQTESKDPLTIVNFIKGLKKFRGKYEDVKINSQGDIILDTTIKTWK